MKQIPWKMWQSFFVYESAENAEFENYVRHAWQEMRKNNETGYQTVYS